MRPALKDVMAVLRDFPIGSVVSVGASIGSWSAGEGKLDEKHVVTFTLGGKKGWLRRCVKEALDSLEALMNNNKPERKRGEDNGTDGW